MSKEIIATANAPQAIGTYSQAVKVGSTVYCSGQIALNPESMEMVNSDVAAEIQQVFRNLAAVAKAAGGGLKDAVKLTVYLTDLGDFATVNEIMAQHVAEPYPARAAVQVSALPKGARVEVDPVLELN